MPFKIVRNDIAKMHVDAIVNTSNPFPVYADGSDTAVYEAAGAKRLLEERKKIGYIEVGQAVITEAFALEAKYIIHTVGPVYKDGKSNEEEELYSCYKNSLELAKENGCESIAFPLISTGTYRYPKAEAMQVALHGISKFLSKEDMMVYLVVFDEESFSVSKKLFCDIDEYIDRNFVQDVLAYEYLNDGVPEPNYPIWDTSDERSKAFRGKVFNTASRCSSQVVKEAVPCYGQKNDLESNRETVCKKKSRSLDDLMTELAETFQERLLRLIDEKGFSDVEIYKKANLSRKLFSKIRCNPLYKPKKMTALALAIALELNLDETIDLLTRAEFALSPSCKFDIIIKYFIEREIYDVYTINLALFEHDQPLLGE